MPCRVRREKVILQPKTEIKKQTTDSKKLLEKNGENKQKTSIETNIKTVKNISVVVGNQDIVFMIWKNQITMRF